jgi:hypothetical protein
VKSGREDFSSKFSNLTGSPDARRERRVRREALAPLRQNGEWRLPVQPVMRPNRAYHFKLNSTN